MNSQLRTGKCCSSRIALPKTKSVRLETRDSPASFDGYETSRAIPNNRFPKTETFFTYLDCEFSEALRFLGNTDRGVNEDEFAEGFDHAKERKALNVYSDGLFLPEL